MPTPERGRLTGLLMMLTLAGLASLGGCNVVGYMAHTVGGGEGPPIRVKAEYTGLANHRTAVLVNADLPLLYRHPQVQLEVTAAVNAELADGVTGISVVEARDVVEYQQRNIYWNTAMPRELMQNLGVDRLVMIDLIEFRTNEPGNSMLYRGVISARVSAFAADADQPNNAVYGNVISAAYPPDRPEGVPDADPLAIRQGALALFARAVGGKFHDYEQPRGE